MDSAPGSSDGEVENEVVGLSEGPDVDVVGLFSVDQVAGFVEEELDAVGVPLGGVDVKGRVGSVADLEAVSSAVAFGVVIGFGVDVRVDFCGVEADVFEDVDFAALWPSDLPDVFSECPEGGPCASSGRDFGSDFDSSVEDGVLSFGGEASAGDFVAVPVVEAGFDDEFAVFDAGVFWSCPGVELGFVVTDKAFFVSPFGGVGEAGLFELVGPDELPFVLLERDVDGLGVGLAGEGLLWVCHSDDGAESGDH